MTAHPHHSFPLKKLLWTFAGLALLGFLDATFLTVEHYVNGTLPCFIGGGCDTVTTSIYSTVAGIPISLLGGLYYIAVLVSTILYIDLRKPLFFQVPLWLVRIGFLFSLWLIYLQLFVLHAVCLYCMLSAATSIALFTISFFVVRHVRMKVV